MNMNLGQYGGRNKAFKNAKELWKAAEAYFEWCDNNPLERMDVVKSGDFAGKILRIPIPRPYRVTGFCDFIGCSRQWYYQQVEARASDAEYVRTFEYIDQRIKGQVFDEATIGNYNPMIAARTLGLTEKTESDVNHKGSINFNLNISEADGCDPIG